MLHYIREHFYSRDLLKYMFEVFIDYAEMKIWKLLVAPQIILSQEWRFTVLNIFKPLNMSILFKITSFLNLGGLQLCYI